MKRRWLALQSVALALVLTWPAPAALGDAALGSVEADGPKHLWTLWWMRREVWTGPWGLRTTLVNAPDGMDIWPIEPLNGLFAALLPVDPVPLSNALAIGHLVAVGLAAGWLGWLLTGRAAGALAAGALAQGCAFTGFALDVGVGELRQLWWVPLGLGLQQVALSSGRWRDYLAVGACIGLATLACLYHGFFLATAVGAVALASPGPGRWRRWAGAAAVGVAIVALPVRAFAAAWAPESGPGSMGFWAWMEAAARTPLETFPAEAAHLDQLVVPGGVSPAWATEQPPVYLGGRYLGLVALGLALAGAVAEPRKALPWLFAGAVGTVLALGTVLWVGGEIVTLGGARVVLPLAWINRALGWLAEPINFPARFVVVPMMAVAALGALATRWRWTWPLVPLALVDIATNGRSTWPRGTFQLPDTAGLEAAAGAGAVANLSPFVGPGPVPTGAVGDSILRRKNPEARLRAIAAQIRLNAPFDIVPIERMDFWAPEGLVWLSALPLAKALPTLEPLPAEDLRADFWLLRERGYDRILITHGDAFGPGDRTWDWLTARLGHPVRSRAATVWTVPVAEATEAEAVAWREAQAARVKAIPRPVAGVAHPGTAGE